MVRGSGGPLAPARAAVKGGWSTGPARRGRSGGPRCSRCSAAQRHRPARPGSRSRTAAAPPHPCTPRRGPGSWKCRRSCPPRRRSRSPPSARRRGRRGAGRTRRAAAGSPEATRDGSQGSAPSRRNLSCPPAPATRRVSARPVPVGDRPSAPGACVTAADPPSIMFTSDSRRTIAVDPAQRMFRKTRISYATRFHARSIPWTDRRIEYLPPARPPFAAFHSAEGPFETPPKILASPATACS